MKKGVILLLFTYLFASNTVVLSKKEKETNTTIIQEETFIRKWLIDKYNAIVPQFLEGEPKENMLKFSVGYDTKDKKIYSRLRVRILLPELEKKYSKQSINRLKTKTIKLKLLPIIQIHKGLPDITVKFSFSYKKESIANEFQFNESIYLYAFHTEYKEITTATVTKFVSINNLMFKIQKTYHSIDKNNIKYKAGLYYYTDLYDFVRSYGFESGGEKIAKPFFYWHKLFFTYRHILFNRRYLYLEFTPYLYYSKEFNYRLKFFINTSLNVKF